MQSTERAREYSRTKDRLALLGTALDIAAGSAFLATGAAAVAGRLLLKSRNPGFAERLPYSAALSLASWLVGLPMAYYSGYSVERRFGLSNQSRGSWSIDTVKAKAISAGLEIALVEGVYATMRRWPSRWWLVCAGAVIPVSAAFAQLFPVLIAPRFNRYEPLRDRELAARLQALADSAGVPIADVLQMDMSRRTSKANAFFTGIGPTRRIVLSDTLLARFTPDEIDGVVGHEAAHQVHRDIWRFVVLAGVLTLVSARLVDLVARRVLRAMPELVGTDELANLRSLPVVALVAGLVGLALAPPQLAYSRHLERLADAFAVNLTGNPAAYAGALQKLAESNLADPNPPRIITIMLHSHPPLGERIAAASSAAVRD